MAKVTADQEIERLTRVVSMQSYQIAEMWGYLRGVQSRIEALNPTLASEIGDYMLRSFPAQRHV